MKIFFILGLILFLSTQGAAQSSKYDWTLPCDTIEDPTQLDMNLCSYERLQKMDSIIKRIYENELASLNASIAERKMVGEQFSTTTGDMELQYLNSLKNSLVSLHRAYQLYLRKAKETMSLNYDGGSMAGLMVGEAAIKIAEGHLAFLEMFSTN